MLNKNVSSDLFPVEALRNRREGERSETLALGAEVLRSESRTLAELADRLDARFDEAVRALLECRGHIVVSGMGKAGLIGRKMVATFVSTGTPALFLHPAEAVHGDLGGVRPDDLVLFLSHSGETAEVLQILPSLERLGVSMLAITRSGSRLAKAADLLLPLDTSEEADPLALAPSNSTTAMLALGDALAFCAARRRGFREEDFARFHPGGALGRKLRSVREVMRPLSECRVASVDQTVRDVFVESRIPGRRSGAILLVDTEGRLAGIFTDSDLAKLFERKNDAPLDRPIAEIMTVSPKTVPLETRWEAAMTILAAHKISELPVLDAHRRPVGLLDITDLL